MKKQIFNGSTMLNPVPVVLITSKNKKGESNVFTVAWTGIMSSEPPLLYISIRPERLSYENITETMEFTVNLPSKNLVKLVDYCGVKSGRKNNKIKECNFTLKKGKKVKSDYIEECPINIECKVINILKQGGSHDIFISEILCTHVNEDLIDSNQKIHFDWADLIVYSHGEYFPLNKKRIGSFGFSVGKKKKNDNINYKNSKKSSNSK
jgi:flavin reductase (DIM6/NTAB) family NADH-FMN oxidoreductase RutF